MEPVYCVLFAAVAVIVAQLWEIVFLIGKVNDERNIAGRAKDESNEAYCRYVEAKRRRWIAEAKLLQISGIIAEDSKEN
jgi:hypothetical protein